MARIGSSDLDVFPLALGGNTFGWTSDEAESFAVLDAFVDGGGNLVDTADVYSAWVEGNEGGESETILGRWMADRGRRDDVVVATKVSQHRAAPGLSRASIRTGVEASLRRLRVETIDLYYAHKDDPETPLEETVAAFGELVAEGKVRHVAASNYSAARLAEALAIADATGAPRFVALQPLYSLVARDEYEGDVADLLVREGLSSLPYSALGSGFLTGKYRDAADASAAGASPRAAGAARFLDDRGRRVLAALDAAAQAHGVEVASVALAWLLTRPGVVAPIASARTVEQLPPLMAAAELRLTPDEVAALDDASR